MKNLKSTRALPSPEEMARIANVSAPHQPPAVAVSAANPATDKVGMLSVRMTESTLEALAAWAIEHNTTQRRIIAEALANRGVRVSARDLEDRPQPRRRGRPT